MRTLLFSSALLTLSALSSAVINNGNFETLPVGTGWQFVSGATTNNYNGLLAFQGTYFGYASSDPILLGAAITASATFAPSETRLRFAYDFFTDETSTNSPLDSPFDDKFELRMISSTGKTFGATVASALTTTVLTTEPNKPSNFYAASGWKIADLNIASYVASLGANEPVTIQFLVSDAGDNVRKSGFAIDAVQAVPEPSAFAALGLGAVALLRRRDRKS